jgi:membrane protein DedA with SNARE-associated domain
VPLTALAGLQVNSAVSYAVAVILPALDAIFPVLPSETVIIGLGVATAGSADPRIALLIACSAAGAFLGDNLCYLLGRRFGPRVEHEYSGLTGPVAARATGHATTPRAQNSPYEPVTVICSAAGGSAYHCLRFSSISR